MLIGYIKVSQHQQQEKKQALKVLSLMLNCGVHEFEQAESVTLESIWPFNNFLSKPLLPAPSPSKVVTSQAESVTNESHAPASRSFTEMLMQYVDRD